MPKSTHFLVSELPFGKGGNRMTYLNEFDATLRQIQGKWKVMILYELYEEGVVRFNTLERYIQDVSPKTLTQQLKQLEQDGLITRTVYPEVPPRVEYALSDKGTSLIPILDAICDWGLATTPRNQLMRTLCDEAPAR